MIFEWDEAKRFINLENTGLILWMRQKCGMESCLWQRIPGENMVNPAMLGLVA